MVAEHRRADGLRESIVPELEALLIPVEPAAYPASRSGSLVWHEMLVSGSRLQHIGPRLKHVMGVGSGELWLAASKPVWLATLR